MKKIIYFIIMMFFLCACQDSNLIKIDDLKGEIKVYLIDNSLNESHYKEESIILDKELEAFVINELRSINNNSKVNSFDKKDDYIIIEINNIKYYFNDLGEFYYNNTSYDLGTNDIFESVCEKLQIGKYSISINFKKISESKYIEYSVMSYNTTDDFVSLQLGRPIENIKLINYDKKQMDKQLQTITIKLDNNYSIHDSRNYAFEYNAEIKNTDSSYILIEYYNASSIVMKRNVSLKNKVNVIY